MIQPGFLVAWRRVMRRHQDLPAAAGRIPMWRLIWGELKWAFRRLVRTVSEDTEDR